MRKIKIVHILNCVGGVEVYIRLLLKNIDENKYEIIIIHGINDTIEQFYYKSGNSVKEYKTNIIREISPLNEIKSIYKCIKIIKKEKPDLLHVHSAKGGVLGRIVGRITNTNVLYTPHAFSYLSETKRIKRALYLFIEKLLANGKSKIIATSNSERTRAIQEVGYKISNVLLFTNSINSIEEIKTLTINKTWPEDYICTVGRPSYQKNIELMISVLYQINKNKSVHLVIMGVGYHADQLDSVKKLIDKLNMSSNITLLNWTHREDVLNIINKSMLYISTSRYEGLPYSIIEALSLSKPCVVSDCDGNRDLIKNGYNGYVIKNENVLEFKEKIIYLLNNNSERDSFSKNSRNEFLEKYDMENNIKILENIYTECS